MDLLRKLPGVVPMDLLSQDRTKAAIGVCVCVCGAWMCGDASGVTSRAGFVVVDGGETKAAAR